MPQTRFVLKKALEQKLKIIVVINKIDKKNARVHYVLEKTFELFIDLGATDEQINFPIIYAASKLGKAGKENNLEAMQDIKPLFETILEEIPPPVAHASEPFQMHAMALAYDNYKGKIAIGRIYKGNVKQGETVMHIDREGKQTFPKITALMTFSGLVRMEVPFLESGDIAAIAGIDNINIGDTLCSRDNADPLPHIDIEPPTVKMTFAVNKSPFAGQEGQYCTSRNIRERLYKELDTDVALKVAEGKTADEFTVSGRGELHLSILIEKMRREGYELEVSRPEVILHQDEKGVTLEPIEEIWMEVPEKYSGIVIEKMGKRRGEMKTMKVEHGITYFHFTIPTRGLIGYRNEFTMDTRGLGIINTLFAGFSPLVGDILSNPHGSLVAFEYGKSNTYGLLNAQERGELFIGHGVDVYKGQVVGQHAKPEDIEVNVCKTKRLSNMRSKGEGPSESLIPPRQMSLEQAIEYIGDDELVEVTPQSIRIRKKNLS
jgi:GTP-binding protein